MAPLHLHISKSIPPSISALPLLVFDMDGRRLVDDGRGEGVAAGGRRSVGVGLLPLADALPAAARTAAARGLAARLPDPSSAPPRRPSAPSRPPDPRPLAPPPPRAPLRPAAQLPQPLLW